MVFVNEKIDGKCVTLDRERGVSLKESGMHPEYGFDFELSIGEQVVKFSAFSKGEVHGQPKVGKKINTM